MTPSTELVSRHVAYLRASAKSSSEAQRIMAEAKSARQADGGTYGWPTPEGTVEWEIAEHITSLEARIAELEGVLDEAFDFLGGVDDAAELRGKIIAGTSQGGKE